MTRDEARQLLPIIQAYSEGKEIEYLSDVFKGWMPVSNEGPIFSSAERYRIKPEPIECWAVVTADGHVYSCESRWDAERWNPKDGRIVRMREV